MCFFRMNPPPMPQQVTPTAPAPPPVAPPPPAPPPPAAPPPAPAPAPTMAYGGGVPTLDAQGNPVMQNIYDPSNPESGITAEKGATLKKARGTSQLRVDLDPVVANMAKQTGLQISK